jgi:diketogulonate reductase-like aldo/keto reductase
LKTQLYAFAPAPVSYSSSCEPRATLSPRCYRYSYPAAQILQIAQKYDKTPAQLILCHTICRGISVIPKTNNPKRILENFDVRFELHEDDFKTVDKLMGERGERGVRNLETRDYLGFDNFNEVIEEP